MTTPGARGSSASSARWPVAGTPAAGAKSPPAAGRLPVGDFGGAGEVCFFRSAGAVAPRGRVVPAWVVGWSGSGLVRSSSGVRRGARQGRVGGWGGFRGRESGPGPGAGGGTPARNAERDCGRGSVGKDDSGRGGPGSPVVVRRPRHAVPSRTTDIREGRGLPPGGPAGRSVPLRGEPVRGPASRARRPVLGARASRGGPGFRGSSRRRPRGARRPGGLRPGGGPRSRWVVAAATMVAAATVRRASRPSGARPGGGEGGSDVGGGGLAGRLPVRGDRPSESRGRAASG